MTPSRRTTPDYRLSICFASMKLLRKPHFPLQTFLGKSAPNESTRRQQCMHHSTTLGEQYLAINGIEQEPRTPSPQYTLTDPPDRLHNIRHQGATSTEVLRLQQLKRRLPLPYLRPRVHLQNPRHTWSHLVCVNGADYLRPLAQQHFQ